MSEYYTCSKCDGNGYTYNRFGFIIVCDNCKGYGKFNWLQNIFGVENIPTNGIMMEKTQEQNITLKIRKTADYYLQDFPFSSALKRIERYLEDLKKSGKLFSYEVQHFKVDYLGSEFVEVCSQIFLSSHKHYLRYDVTRLRKDE